MSPEFTDDDFFAPTTKMMYKGIRERIRQLRMQYTEPLAAIMLEQLEDPTEKW